MRLSVRHTTTYSYDGPVPYGLQQVRLTPKSGSGQTIVDWRTRIEGGQLELSFTDQNRNTVQLVSFAPGATRLSVTSEGIVDVQDMHGVIGTHGGFTPLWMFERPTEMTRAGVGCRSIVAAARIDGEPLERLHRLSHEIRARVAWETGRTESGWTAEEAITAGKGVCQDHAHIFIACARSKGFPARYVSGYLLMEDRTVQDATHAWAEAHVPGLGWVGFDISNGISPDTRYVRVATGRDYGEAAPIHGTRYGQAQEDLDVTVEVAQIQQ
ncbi:transglutaminase family protein [Wenxinia saemankumensis]|uniref:Transglutaminase-like enzyme, putative cysteine protease n=1 Tax=Wenxinia saemankumensis TaxID=1447782 RepID=A0A1M6AYY7_9RHOB|nr:transglutaminase family protein [Wenxinia saemankumensis]SHI41672.1 Transglutaminase-like enzyme, putative cysteine protease [Wenxinia saemankumensis]